MKAATLIASFIAVALCGDTPQSPSAVGRFQVVTGEFFNRYDYKTLIKVDTVTGRTWKLGQISTNSALGWYELPTFDLKEPPSAPVPLDK
jgi:hypothetical protein